MEKKITISVITQEGNYGGEATGHTILYTAVYFYLHRLLFKQTRSGRLSASTKHSGCTPSSSSLDGSKWVSISNKVEWVAVNLPHRRTVSLSLYLVRLIHWLTSLQLIDKSFKKPKELLMPREEFYSLCSFSSLPEKHLEICSLLTVINTGWGCYLFSCGQLQTTSILHSSCQSKFKIGDDHAWEQ